MARSQAPVVASHVDLGDHDKTKQLCSMLSIRRAEGIGLITGLWHYCARNSPIEGAIVCSHGTLADEVYWAGDPDALWQALIESGYIDIGLDGRARAHEWVVYGSEQQLQARKRDYDRRRLQTLRNQEQQSLALDMPEGPAPASKEESDLPENERIHVALLGNGDPPLPNDLRRINRTLERYPTTDGYDVALGYIAWQLDIAKSYREHKKGPQPHSDLIKGWSNQMKMNAGKGWNRRDSPLRQSQKLDFGIDDMKKYAS